MSDENHYNPRTTHKREPGINFFVKGPVVLVFFGEDGRGVEPALSAVLCRIPQMSRFQQRTELFPEV